MSTEQDIKSTPFYVGFLELTRALTANSVFAKNMETLANPASAFAGELRLSSPESLNLYQKLVMLLGEFSTPPDSDNERNTNIFLGVCAQAILADEEIKTEESLMLLKILIGMNFSPTTIAAGMIFQENKLQTPKLIPRNLCRFINTFTEELTPSESITELKTTVEILMGFSDKELELLMTQPTIFDDIFLDDLILKLSSAATTIEDGVQLGKGAIYKGLGVESAENIYTLATLMSKEVKFGFLKTMLTLGYCNPNEILKVIPEGEDNNYRTLIIKLNENLYEAEKILDADLWASRFWIKKKFMELVAQRLVLCTGSVNMFTLGHLALLLMQNKNDLVVFVPNYRTLKKPGITKNYQYRLNAAFQLLGRTGNCVVTNWSEIFDDHMLKGHVEAYIQHLVEDDFFGRDQITVLQGMDESTIEGKQRLEFRLGAVTTSLRLDINLLTNYVQSFIHLLSTSTLTGNEGTLSACAHLSSTFGRQIWHKMTYDRTGYDLSEDEIAHLRKIYRATMPPASWNYEPAG